MYVQFKNTGQNWCKKWQTISMHWYISRMSFWRNKCIIYNRTNTFWIKYNSVCTCTARLTYFESRHTKEEGKCLSASEHHRITPSYTDSTSELPLLSFVFSSIFFSLSKFLTHTERLYFSAFVGKKTFSIKMLPNFSVIMSLPPPIFFKKEWWHRRLKALLIRE